MIRTKYFVLGAALVLASLLYVLHFEKSKLITPPLSQRSDLELYQRYKSWRGNSPMTNIIILTYMRSGSTLTGSLLEHHPDVFYVFEPMHNLKWIWWSEKVHLHFLSQGRRYVKNIEEFSWEAVRIANGFLNCDFVDIDIATLSQFHLASSNDTAMYRTCIASKGGGVTSILPCLDILYQSCSKSSISALKTIRFPMKAVESMMETNTSLKVVHLIRDPRPTIRSQIMFGRSHWGNLVEYSKEFCNRVEADLEVTKRLMTRYPDRVMLLQYEDLTKNPVKHVKELYSFAGLEYTDETENFVESITASETEERCALCLQTINSTARSLRWRNKINYERAHTIDENCKTVYKSLGYIPVESAGHLKDLGRDLKTERNI